MCLRVPLRGDEQQAFQKLFLTTYLGVAAQEIPLKMGVCVSCRRQEGKTPNPQTQTSRPRSHKRAKGEGKVAPVLQAATAAATTATPQVPAILKCAEYLLIYSAITTSSSTERS